MPNFVTNILWLLGLLAFNGVLAAARSALVSASRPRLRQLAEAGNGAAGLAGRVAEDSTRLIATMRLAQSLCRFFAAGLAALLFEPSFAEFLRQWPSLAPHADPLAFFAVLLLTALIVVSVGELFPEAWVMRAPEDAAIFFAPFVAALEWALSPVVRLLLHMSTRLTAPLAGKNVPFVTEEEIKTLVDAGEEGGVIEEEEKEMIYSIFEIDKTMAREIMVPRIDVLALDVETPVSEAFDTVLNVGHSRIPVYQDSVDNVVGLLYAKDLLRACKAQSQAASLRLMLRPAYFIPETKMLDELLAELQSQRIHMAIVVDEYGGTAGIVTLEDIVEEIVGDIRDEYDVNEEAYYEAAGDEAYIFDARINLDEVNDLLQLKLPTDDSDTLGGFIYGQLGHVPAPGEHVQTAAARFEVLTVSGRRIRKVRGARLAQPAADLPADAPPTESPADA
jgi:CBS domain containing-hemolysin-like protein